jgi:purine-binding chemotaxis protein CheW
VKRFVLFRAAQELFGIPIEAVVEVLRAQRPNPLPEMPPHILGLITLRGEVLPLVDIRKRFGLSPQPANERVVVVRSRGEKIGVVVDEVLEIAKFQEEELSEPPSIFKGLRAEYLTGLAKRKDGSVVILLNMDMVLSSEERLLLRAGDERGD